MLVDVIDVEPLEGYRVRLRFDNGVEGELDFRPLLKFEGVFKPLEDPSYFARVRVDPNLGTICWPSGADWDPDVLYSYVTGSPLPGDEDRTTGMLDPASVHEMPVEPERATRIGTGSVGGQHAAFWRQLASTLDAARAPLALGRPSELNYVYFPALGPGVSPFAARDSRGSKIYCGLEFHGDAARENFEALLRRRREVHWVLEPTLEWRPMIGHKTCQIRVELHDVDPCDQGDWGQQLAWLALRLTVLANEFSRFLSPVGRP